MSGPLKTLSNDLKNFTLPYYKLKELLRTGWVEKLQIENSESVASHTLLMIVIVLFIATKYSFSCEKKLKLIEMALIHDVAESIVGDITPESISYTEKRQIEDNAFKLIMEKLPQSKLKLELSRIWKEYNENKSFDSKLVHIIDKLEMMLQADFYHKYRKNVERSNINPFKKSVSLFVRENTDYFKVRMNSKTMSTEDKELNEIKEILAYLCK
ncbi:MAG TPA: HD domain-containing protein [Candidatus Nitrosocosmicus sp.]|nr:HD domain-containing protein [Candidatus Nitrosocosmicus sp.]